MIRAVILGALIGAVMAVSAYFLLAWWLGFFDEEGK